MKNTQVTLLDGSIVTVNEITFGSLKDTRQKATEFDNNVALVMASTDIKGDVLEEMPTPDFNQLFIAAVNLNEPDYVPKRGATTASLSNPAVNLMGESLAEVKILMPKVKTSRELAAITGYYERMEYMIKSSTGLVDLDSLAASDWALLVSIVPDFFAQGAAYFRLNK